MELALYHPDEGYYSRDLGQVGVRGDFITSVSSGGMFGHLLAEYFRLAEQESFVSTDGPFHLIEAGAHDGRLACDILEHFAESAPENYRSLNYLIVEPSPQRQAAQERLLKAHLNHVTWVKTWDRVPESSLNGFIFSNELLDAFPVERIFWNASHQRWVPWRVSAEADGFVWYQNPDLPIPESVLQFTERTPSALRPYLPDGFTTELNPAACDWWQAAAKRLKKGILLAIDYGLKEEEFFAPHRFEGTLRAYYRQQQTPDLLARPGRQDLTSHVNFSAIESAGHKTGMQTLQLQSQESFFMTILQKLMSHKPDSPLLRPEKLKAFQTLVHPSHFGRSFSVLTQQRL